MAVPQWGLGAYERYLSGEGDGWLAAAVEAARYLVAEQTHDNGLRGGWLEPFDYPHTYDIRGPWLSAMAQGQCASLLVRLYLETGEGAFAEAALHGLEPMLTSTASGGVQAVLDGDPFQEEYPTNPPSYVLNGAIFALWGSYDVWKGLDDRRAAEAFEQGAAAVAKNLHRWDTGYWSRYDLYPHALVHVASPAYHTLHITQLSMLASQTSDSRIDPTLSRFEEYAHAPASKARAVAHKVLFRLLIPRNKFLARRLPWTAASR